MRPCADCRHAASFEISPEDGSRPWLDPHSSGGGGKRTHALVDILETETARPDLQTVCSSYSGADKACLPEIRPMLTLDSDFLAGPRHESLLHHLPRAPAPLPSVSLALDPNTHGHRSSKHPPRSQSWRERLRRFVGYIEEEAVNTYTIIMDAIDKGAPLP